MQPVARGALRILHLSDTHLRGDGTLHQGSVDTEVALRALFGSIDGVTDVGLVVVSGDCSDDGGPASYETLRDIVGGWAKDHGAAFVAVPGNHDQREGFRAVLANGHLLGEGGTPLAHTLEYLPPEVPVTGMSIVGGWRIVTLDTSVPGAGWGELSERALERLQTWTAEPATHGTIVVLHHPPLAAPTALHEALRLQNTEDLARVLGGTDVRLILAGHYHHHFVGSLGDVPVLVAPGVANDTDVTGPWDEERAVVGTGALIVDITEDGSIRSTPIRVPRPDDGAEVLHLSAAEVADVARAFGRS